MELNGDSYSYQRAEAFNQYAPALSGCHNAYILALSTHPFSDPCIDAMRKSFRARGYGEDAVTYGVATDTLQRPSTLFQFIESLDPGILVLADQDIIDLIYQVYRVSTPIAPVGTIGGRTVAAFSDMEKLMQTQAGKQHIWAAIKLLPALA